MDHLMESRSLRPHKRAFKLSDLFNLAIRVPNADTAIGAAGHKPPAAVEQFQSSWMCQAAGECASSAAGFYVPYPDAGRREQLLRLRPRQPIHPVRPP